MTKETDVSPDADTQIPAPELANTEPELATPEPAEEPQTEKAEPTEAEKRAKALERRIQRLTRDKYELRAQLENAASASPQPAEEPQQIDPQALRAYVQQEAERIAAAKATETRATEVERALKRELKDGFADFYSELSSAGVQGARLLQTALELDEPAKVLAQLARDPDEFDRVIGMSTLRQAAYLGALTAKAAPPPKTSSAPRPLTPVRAASRNDELSDDLSADEWARRRNEQLRARSR